MTAKLYIMSIIVPTTVYFGFFLLPKKKRKAHALAH